MAASDAKPVPIRNQAYRLTFESRKNDGTLITTGTGMDTELSGDAGTGADATNEAIEIATNWGTYYIDLTAAEMNFDTVVVRTTWTNTNALPSVIVLNPQESGDIKVDLQSILGTLLTETSGLIAAGFKKFFNVATPTGTVNSLPDVVPGANLGLPTVNASNEVKALPSNGSISSATFAAGAINAAALAADAITDAKVAADVTIASVTGSVGSIAASGIAAASFAAGAIDANAVATDAFGSLEVSAAAITEIQTGLATAASISALNDISPAEVNTEVTNALGLYDPTTAGWLSRLKRILGLKQ